MRLIDADKLKAHYAWWEGGTREMTMGEAKKDFDTIIDLQPTIEAEPKGSFHDGYAYCLMDFGKDTVLCTDCKHYKQSAVADRKMCFRKDVDGIEVCYDFLPYDSCTYGERRDEVEE